MQNTNGDINNSINNENDDYNDGVDDNDKYDTSEYDSHLASLVNTPYFSQDKNYNSKRRRGDVVNIKNKKRKVPKPLSRK